jgi:NifU-like protein involved in Fe-S cluster formation
MTAVCRDSCCSSIPRQTVSELFERGFRRSRAASLSIEGATCTDAEGNTARFSLDLKDGRIAAVGFHASACATLIAYSELVAEFATGLSSDVLTGVTAEDLITALPGVHPLKRGRAVLALAAFRAALVATAQQDQA